MLFKLKERENVSKTNFTFCDDYCHHFDTLNRSKHHHPPQNNLSSGWMARAPSYCRLNVLFLSQREAAMTGTKQATPPCAQLHRDLHLPLTSSPLFFGLAPDLHEKNSRASLGLYELKSYIFFSAELAGAKCTCLPPPLCFDSRATHARALLPAANGPQH